MSQQTVDGSLIEVIAIIERANDDATCGRSKDRDWIVGLFENARVAKFERSAAGPQRISHRVVLECKHRIEQRQPRRHIAPALDRYQRRVLVLPNFSLQPLNSVEPGNEFIMRSDR